MRQRLRQEVLLGIIAVLFVILTPLSSFAETINYTYDDAYRLTQVATDTGFVEAYTYDEVGNRLTLDVTVPTDTTPDVFSFGSMSDVALNSLVESSPITITGINTPAALSITGGEYSISTDDGATWSAYSSTTPATVEESAMIKVRQTSGATYGATTIVTLTVGGVSADFSVTTIPAHIVTPMAGVGGIVLPDTPQTVSDGATTSFTVAPDEGYQIGGASGCGGTLAGSTFTTGPITDDCAVTVTFAINTYTVMASAGSNGTITPSGSVTAQHGSTQTYTITPNAGYAIADLLIDGVSAGALSSYTFTNITASHTIAASFRPLSTLTVSVETSQGRKLTGIKTYLFNETGTYMNLSQTTDTNGTAIFSTPSLASGNYKIRADYLGYQFWSPVFSLPNTGAVSVLVPEQTATLSITPMIAGIKTYLFTASGAYVNKTVTTDSAGTAAYDIPTGRSYKIRADYLSQHYWSPVTAGEDVSITIPISDADITVTGNGLPVSGVKVYLFNGAGTYLNISGTTDAAGAVSFHIPSGTYKFRADYQAKQFWSQNETLNPDETKAISLSTGGGTFTLAVFKGQTTGLAGAKCYVFNQGGSPYLNLSATTDTNGQVSFSLADGSYQFRIDHLGNQFWTEAITIPNTLSQSILIDHKEIAITVQGRLDTDISPIANIPVYLFNPSGTYLNITQNTDTSGKVSFSLPDRPFLARTDYLGRQFWSDAINYQDTAITIPEGIASVHVNIHDQDIAGNRVYLYGETGTYLNVSALTDAGGIAEFRLPEATYTFRTDYQSQQLRVTAGIDRDVTTAVKITAPSTIFRLHADIGTGALADVRAYVFNEAGTYLNISGMTDGSGMASFSLISGRYRIRLDYLGYQYWTDVITIPDTTEAVLSIPHDYRAVTVQGIYGVESSPIANIPVYLFTPTGAYQGITRTTDPNGQAFFFLPDADYKLRADYLGTQFWSAIFNATDTAVTVNEGIVRLIVTRAGLPVSGAKVYLFSEAGAYLGRFITTDAAGIAEFILPDMNYQFRIDEAGQQHWSGLIDVVTGQVNEVLVELP